MLDLSSPDMSAYAEKALKELGVVVELNKAVTAVHADGVEYGGTLLKAETIILGGGCAGLAGRQVARASRPTGRVG